MIELPEPIVQAIKELQAASYQVGFLDRLVPLEPQARSEAQRDEERALEGLELAVATWGSARAEQAVRSERERTGASCWLAGRGIGDCALAPARFKSSEKEQAMVLEALKTEEEEA